MSLRCLACALLVGGCALNSASIEQQWRAPEVQASKLTNVVAMVPARDGALRRNSEDILAAQLQSRGMRAVPAYRVLSPDAYGDKDRATAAMKLAGFDGVIAMRFVGAEHRVDYEPGYWTFWGGRWDTVLPETIVRIEINAYSLDDDRLVWSAMSKSTDADSVEDLIRDVTSVAARELEKERVITASR
jgi:hypothetical protein